MKTFSSDEILEEFYLALADGSASRVRRVHIPMSDVFYVRMAYYNDTGHWVSLDRMERAMFLEGHLKAKDVFEPERKRDWEYGDTEEEGT
jgi:hypothetical protein